MSRAEKPHSTARKSPRAETLPDATIREVTPLGARVGVDVGASDPVASGEPGHLEGSSPSQRENWGCPLCGAIYSPELTQCPVDGERLLTLSWIHTEADALVGVVIQGRYELESVLGRGGMGTVYQARHRALGKRFAVKVLRPEVAVDADSVKRFMQEAQIAASVKHDNLADVSDCGEISSADLPSLGSVRLPFFVMEMLRGQSLGERLRESGTIDAALGAELLRQCALGLSAAHEAGVIHRDLKPDNIFLTEVEGKVVCKILDFGVAKIMNRAKLTQAGTVFGTPYYMSPEQASGGVLDGRTDLYALGVVLYEAMSGRVPFSAETHMGVLTKHVFEVPAPIETVVSDPSSLGPLGPIIMCCLEKDPAARYKDATELALAVEHAMAVGFSLPAERPQPALRLRAPMPMGATRTSPSPKKGGQLPTWFLVAVPAGILLGLGLALISRMFLHRTAAPAPSVATLVSAAPVVSAAPESQAAAPPRTLTSASASGASPSAAASTSSSAGPPHVPRATAVRSAEASSRPSGVIDTW